MSESFRKEYLKSLPPERRQAHRRLEMVLERFVARYYDGKDVKLRPAHARAQGSDFLDYELRDLGGITPEGRKMFPRTIMEVYQTVGVTRVGQVALINIRYRDSEKHGKALISRLSRMKIVREGKAIIPPIQDLGSALNRHGNQVLDGLESTGHQGVLPDYFTVVPAVNEGVSDLAVK